MQSLKDKLALIFKYPLSPNQSIKGFFREMDNYGKVSQKTLYECLVCIADHVESNDQSTVNTDASVSLMESLVDRMDKIQFQLDELQKSPLYLSEEERLIGPPEVSEPETVQSKTKNKK